MGRRWCGDDAGMSATGAGGAIAAAVDPPMGPDFDFQDHALVSAGERNERLPAAATPLLLGGQFDDCFDGGPVRVLSALRSWLASLLSARSRRSGGPGGAVGGGCSRGLAAEELLFEGAGMRASSC